MEVSRMRSLRHFNLKNFRSQKHKGDNDDRECTAERRRRMGQPKKSSKPAKEKDDVERTAIYTGEIRVEMLLVAKGRNIASAHIDWKQIREPCIVVIRGQRRIRN
ncbi:hypothetical protein QE152_g893 [Popillia japonica]|uniref:Uncharacterized protein n=1 Tax=Popillia japonica TaxID=7064 RepID=A0AAW1NDW1_POPJA